MRCIVRECVGSSNPPIPSRVSPSAWLIKEEEGDLLGHDPETDVGESPGDTDEKYGDDGKTPDEDGKTPVDDDVPVVLHDNIKFGEGSPARGH